MLQRNVKIFISVFILLVLLPYSSFAQTQRKSTQSINSLKQVEKPVILNSVFSGYTDENWDNQFTREKSLNWFGGDVKTFGKDVYLGGGFTSAEGKQCKYIAKWNESTGWSNLGQGLTYNVIGMNFIGNDLWVGGEFGAHYGVSGNYVAIWNGINWTIPGGGVDNNVVAFEPYRNDVIVVGSFVYAANVRVNRVAIWNPNQKLWLTLGKGFDADVNGIAVDGEDIYVGGSFQYCGSERINKIAKWDAYLGKWVSICSGVIDFIKPIIIDGDYIYFGGGFSSIENMQAKNIARWNKKNNSWFNLNGGVQGNGSYIYTMVMKGDNLYVGGVFSSAGGTNANNVAIWNKKTETWSAIGSGVNGDVAGVAVTDKDLYLTGTFTQAGGKPSYYFARYRLPGNVPYRPVLIYPANLTNIPVQNTLLTWNKISSETYYRVQVSTTPNFSNIILDHDKVFNDYLQVNNLTNGRDYYWRVNATNIFGTSEWSEIWMFHVGAGKFRNSFPLLSLPLNNANNMTMYTPLIWLPLEGAVTYRLQLAMDPDFSELLIDKSDITNAYFQIDRLLSNTKYYWRVNASNGSETSMWSEIRNFTTKVVTKAEEKILVNEFILSQNYPNPFNPSTTIEYNLPKNSNVNLKIYNIHGVELEILVNKFQTAGRYTVKWEPKNLTSGIYYYIIIFDGKEKTGKMVYLR